MACDVDTVINELKDRVGKDWKKVARELKFSQTAIDAIEYKGRDDLKEHIHLFFEEWKMREGRAATVQMLVAAVKAARLQRILDEIMRLLPDSQYSKDSSDATPLQETSQKPTSLASPTNNSELEHLRKKRLEKFSSTGSDKPDSLPKREASEQTVLRSVSTASSSSALSEETESYRRNVTSDSPPPVKDSKGSPPKRVEFEVGGLVKVEHKPKPWYGVIKWIGDLSGVPGTVAGVEMDERVDGGHSGTLKGKCYFKCEDGHGLLLPLSKLKPDDRFGPPSLIGGATPTGEDAEKDEQLVSSSPRPKVSVASPQPNRKDETFNFCGVGESKVPATESTDDGATPSSEVIRCFECPGDVAGIIIGRDGKNRMDVESETDTRIRVEKNQQDMSANTKVLIRGREENCKRAFCLIVQNIRRKTALHISTTETMMIQNQNLCKRVIGREGANVQAIENLTGTRINIERKKGLEALLDSDGPRKCKITGLPDQIEDAKELITMALEGVDIAQVIATFLVKLVKHLKSEGFTFAESD